MTADAMHAVHALNHAYLRLHPVEARQVVNKLSTVDVVELLQLQPVAEMVKLLENIRRGAFHHQVRSADGFVQLRNNRAVQ